MELAKIMLLLLLAFIPKFSICLPKTSSPQENKLPFMTSDASQVSGKSFDYIVVGGGTTGCSLTATLSERFSVLLVERGGLPYGNPLIQDKKYHGYSFLQTDEFTSVAQAFISKEGVRNLRGRVLGGTSSINAGFYSRAGKDFVKRAGWDHDLVMKAYQWVESKIVFKPVELTKWQSVVQYGLLEAGILPYNGFNLEHVEGTKISGSVFDNGGKRHSSADLLKAGNPENITVLLNATVKNVIISRNGMDESNVHGITFIKSHGSIAQSYKAYLNKPKNSILRGEIILSAGALGSPQILLLSGIGPPKHLNSFNIPAKVDLEGVGQEMIDNPGISLLVDTKPQKLYSDTPQVVGISKGFEFYVEAFILPVSFNTSRRRISIKMAFPSSKGKLELNGTDPRRNPSVEFNYLSNKQDLEQCVEMTRLVSRVASSESVALFLGNKLKNNNLTSGSEEELKLFCKKNVRTFYHYHGGCAVGSVVDQNYKVYGVNGLRVIDGSTLKESPGTNPMATLLMLGRYQGIKILKERKDA